jgi:hypothetical protein
MPAHYGNKGGKGSSGRVSPSKAKVKEMRKAKAKVKEVRKAISGLSKKPSSDNAKIKNFNHAVKAVAKKTASRKPSGMIGGR